MSSDQREQMDLSKDFVGQTPPSPSALDGAQPLEVCPEPERYAGYGLCDPLGQKIGRVERIFANDTGSPEYVKVTMGLRRRSVFVPANRLAVDELKRTLNVL